MISNYINSFPDGSKNPISRIELKSTSEVLTKMRNWCFPFHDYIFVGLKKIRRHKSNLLPWKWYFNGLFYNKANKKQVFNCRELLLQAVTSSINSVSEVSSFVGTLHTLRYCIFPPLNYILGEDVWLEWDHFSPR